MDGTEYDKVKTMAKEIRWDGCLGQEAPEILESRTRTFLAWINKKTESLGINIQSLTDLDSGIVLIRLLECLSPGKKISGRYLIFN